MLEPMGATLSSTYLVYRAFKCIDGDITGSFCQTNEESAPWIAIDYGTEVTVHKVELFDITHCCPERTDNVHVWVSDELPTSSSQLFRKGNHLGVLRDRTKENKPLTISGLALL